MAEAEQTEEKQFPNLTPPNRKGSVVDEYDVEHLDWRNPSLQSKVQFRLTYSIRLGRLVPVPDVRIQSTHLVILASSDLFGFFKF